MDDRLLLTSLTQFFITLVVVFAQHTYETGCPYPVPPDHAVLSAQSYLDEFNFNGFQAYQRVNFICRIGYRQTKGAMWSICGVSGRWYPDTRNAGECSREIRTGEVECKGRFRCRKDLQCIDRKLRCDCNADCRDGTDEIGCKNPKKMIFVNPKSKETSGIITSPNYPLGYPKTDFRCRFIFYTDPSYRVKLSFEEFSLRNRERGKCPDYIRVSGMHPVYLRKLLLERDGQISMSLTKPRTQMAVTRCGKESFGELVSNNSRLEMMVRLSGEKVRKSAANGLKLRGYSLSWKVISETNAADIVNKVEITTSNNLQLRSNDFENTGNGKVEKGNLLSVILPVAISALLPASLLWFICYHYRTRRARSTASEPNGNADKDSDTESQVLQTKLQSLKVEANKTKTSNGDYRPQDSAEGSGFIRQTGARTSVIGGCCDAQHCQGHCDKLDGTFVENSGTRVSSDESREIQKSGDINNTAGCGKPNCSASDTRGKTFAANSTRDRLHDKGREGDILYGTMMESFPPKDQCDKFCSKCSGCADKDFSGECDKLIDGCDNYDLAAGSKGFCSVISDEGGIECKTLASSVLSDDMLEDYGESRRMSEFRRRLDKNGHQSSSVDCKEGPFYGETCTKGQCLTADQKGDLFDLHSKCLVGNSKASPNMKVEYRKNIANNTIHMYLVNGREFNDVDVLTTRGREKEIDTWKRRSHADYPRSNVPELTTGVQRRCRSDVFEDFGNSSEFGELGVRPHEGKPLRTRTKKKRRRRGTSKATKSSSRLSIPEERQASFGDRADNLPVHCEYEANNRIGCEISRRFGSDFDTRDVNTRHLCKSIVESSSKSSSSDSGTYTGSEHPDLKSSYSQIRPASKDLYSGHLQRLVRDKSRRNGPSSDTDTVSRESAYAGSLEGNDHGNCGVTYGCGGGLLVPYKGTDEGHCKWAIHHSGQVTDLDQTSNVSAPFTCIETPGQVFGHIFTRERTNRISGQFTGHHTELYTRQRSGHPGVKENYHYYCSDAECYCTGQQDYESFDRQGGLLYGPENFEPEFGKDSTHFQSPSLRLANAENNVANGNRDGVFYSQIADSVSSETNVDEYHDLSYPDDSLLRYGGHIPAFPSDGIESYERNFSYPRHGQNRLCPDGFESDPNRGQSFIYPDGFENDLNNGKYFSRMLLRDEISPETSGNGQNMHRGNRHSRTITNAKPIETDRRYSEKSLMMGDSPDNANKNGSLSRPSDIVEMAPYPKAYCSCGLCSSFQTNGSFNLFNDPLTPNYLLN